MLIWFVVVYLLVSIAIGLYAATRVHNAKDFAVAGRSLPLPVVTATVFATWFGAEAVFGVSATFVKDGLRHHTQRTGPHHHQPDTLSQVWRQRKGADEGTGQQGLMLDCLHAADCADEPVCRGCERSAIDRDRSGGRRCETVCINAVVDLRYARRRNANPLRQVRRQVLGQSDVSMYER